MLQLESEFTVNKLLSKLYCLSHKSRPIFNSIISAEKVILGNFFVQLRFTERGTETTDLTVHVPSRELSDFTVVMVASCGTSVSVFLHCTNRSDVVIANERMNNFFMMFKF
jgi:hypothetical protein